jgi:hypothetical protein
MLADQVDCTSRVAEAQTMGMFSASLQCHGSSRAATP